MNFNKNQIGSSKNSAAQSTNEHKLYSLLFAGKITMKEYVHMLAAITAGKK